MEPTRFVPANFLAGIPAHLSSTRRVLVTQAALYGVDRPSKLDEIRSAMRVWSLEQRQRPGVTTVLSILLELEALGAIGGFEVVEGGFVVGKERAA